MKVILKEDVKTLGKKNQMVEVSDGYAKNFLFPRGLAVEANNSNVNQMKNKQEAEKHKKENELANAKKLAEKINEITLTFSAKAGETGKLFGSITAKDIAEKLKKEHKLDVDKRKIIAPDGIKTLGNHTFEVKLYPSVTTSIKIVVKSEA